MRNRWLTLLAALALFCGAGIATVAVAQTTGDIEGTVLDENGASLPGALVELKSPALLGTRAVVTDSTGRFRFPALPPGTYTVTGSLSGFTTVERSGVAVGLGRTVSIPLTMSVSVKEVVVVTGEAPVVDITRTSIGTSASAETIQKLPLDRNFTSLANTVAGTGTDAANGVTVYGATSLENQYVIDGVNTTGVKVGDQGKQLNQEFVQEVEVKTGGYEAEYGRALGGVINVITKSGGNEFHGDAFGYYDSSSLASADIHNGKSESGKVFDRESVSASQFYSPKRWDFGLDAGGYFVKDRLWFFGAYDRVHRDQDYERVSALTYGSGSLPPKPTYVPETDRTRTNIYSAKLTLRLGESNTFGVTVFGDPGSLDGRLNNQRGPASATRGSIDTGGTDFSVKYDGIFGTQLLAQVQYGHHADSSRMHSPYENTLSRLEYRRGVSINSPGAGPSYFSDEKYTRDAFKVSGSYFYGSHEIKGGVDYESLDSSFSEKYPGGERVMQFLDSDSGAFQYAYHRYFMTVPVNCTMLKNGATGNFGVVPSGTGDDTCAAYQPASGVRNPPRTRNLALFLQDSYKLLPSLTVNAGIRWEQQKLLDADGSTGVKLDDEWSPRIGIVWDPLRDGRSKVFASYGRYYELIPQDIQTRALGNEFTVFAYNYCDGTPGSAGCLAGGTQPATDPSFFEFGYPMVQGAELVQDGLKGMYQDEVILGVEYEFLRNWSLGVKGIYRSLGRAVEDRCDLYDNRVHLDSFVPSDKLVSCALVNVGEGNALGVIKDPNNPACVTARDDNGEPTDLDGACESIHASRIYRGFETTVTHRFADSFYLLASYIYSKLQGNYSGNLSQTRETGQFDPNINADYDYVDLTPNAFGRLRNDRTHQLKLSGLYSLPFGVSVGLNTSFQTGRPMSIRGYARSGYSQERYLVARGSWYDLPSTYQVDLHLEYGARFGPVTISPVVDVFNVTNVQTVTSREEQFCGTRAACPTLGELGSFVTPPTTQKGPTTQYPDGNRNFNRDIAWQQPRVIRLGARVSF